MQTNSPAVDGPGLERGVRPPAPKRGTVDYADWLADKLHATNDYGKDAAALLMFQARALEYMTAARTQCAPAWVPDRVMLAKPVRGDFPIGHNVVAEANVYTAQCNRWGAVSVRAPGGMLGLKPGEFEVVSWRANEAAERSSSAGTAPRRS